MVKYTQMKSFFGKLHKSFLVGFLAFALVGGAAYSVALLSNKAFAYSVRAVQSPATTLYSGISSGATSARLRSFVDIYGNNLTMTMFGSIGYVTFEPGVRGKEEVVSFTGITNNGDGTQTITGLSRGLLSRYPFGSGGTARSHGSNTYVVVSNAGEFYEQIAFKRNDETVSGLWTFNSQLPTSNLLATQTNQFVTQAYVIGSVLSGAATATESVTGISRLATAAQTASSTASTANTPLVIQAQTATDTPNTLTRATRVLMSDMTGYLKQGWLNLSQAFTFGDITATGTATFSGNTTMATTTISTNLIGKSFGGTGVDGALTISSGNTEIDLGGATTTVKNYTSIAITGTGALRFSNPNPQGSTVILRSQGACTLTSSAAPMLSATSTGGIGGYRQSTANAEGIIGSTTLGTIYSLVGGGGGLTTGAAVAGGSLSLGMQNLGTSSIKYPYLVSGSGGGSGSFAEQAGGGTSYGGRGGRGGGVIVMECGGVWTFTTAGGISVAGNDGENAAYGSTRGTTGGGGGGGGGVFLALYNYLGSNSGTVTVTGGSGGTGVHVEGAGMNASTGAGGGASVNGAGTAGTTAEPPVSGAGRGGVSSIIQNIFE